MVDENKLKETRGTFQAKGIVSGVESNNFYSDKPTKTQKPRRSINFRLQVASDQSVFLNLWGMQQEKVYFYPKDKDKEAEIVPWDKRLSFNKKDYRLGYGVNLGLVKTEDGTGKTVNSQKNLTQYDACKHINENLKDGMSVYVRGNIEYSHYTKNGEIQRFVKLVPTQISLCQPIDFAGEDFEATCDFEQFIVYMGVDREDNKATVDASIVRYNTVETNLFSFQESDKGKSLFKNFKTLKPYTYIKISGMIKNEDSSDVVEVQDDLWGEPSKMDRQFASYGLELFVTGAVPDSIDRETYNEESMQSAIASMVERERASSDFGETSDSDDYNEEEDADSDWD